MLYGSLARNLHYFFLIITYLLIIRFTAEEKAKRPQLSHMPFGFGPRNCIGMRFALLEAKIALIELLKRYTFVRTADTEVSNCLLSLCMLEMTPPPPPRFHCRQ